MVDNSINILNNGPTTDTATDTTTVSVTPLAAKKIKGLIAEKELTGYGLRVFIKSGGCAGYEYGLGFDQPGEKDQVFDEQGVKVIIDPTSLTYVQGARIDFVDSLMGGGFRIENPNAVVSCGCGTSFRTEQRHPGKAPAMGSGGCGCG